MASTRWEQLLYIASISGNAIEVRHSVRGDCLDGGCRACHRFHSLKAPMVPRVCESTTALSSNRRWCTMHSAACQCCCKSGSHVRSFPISSHYGTRFTDQTRLASTALFLLTWKTTDPYRAHFLGIHKAPELLPFTLAYKKGDRPMFSEMSFKCRLTSTFSSYTLPEPNEDTLYTLYPTRPEKAYGLGIYAPKASVASFLTPRPSPLPVYDPAKYKDMSGKQKAELVPRRVYTLRRKSSQRGALRAVQCSPLPLGDKPRTLDRSVSKESLSSIYSRSVSGESPDPSRGQGLGKPIGRQPNTSTASATIGRNHLSSTRAGARCSEAHQPRFQSKLRQDCLSRTAQNPTTRLRVVRAVSDFGSVQDWAAGSDGRLARSGRVSTWSERCNLPPLPVEKTKIGRP
jgi:hypothetical protein